jgi:3-phenylpropionate/trans-cinnamate dioxygenase ferredoxin subunit
VKVVVASAAEIGPGERKIVDVAGRSIGVFNLGGEFFALRNRCPHQGGALCEGRLWGVLRAERPGEFEYEPSREILTCPWHGWEFHVRTGQSWCAPARLAVRSYEVSVVAGSELEVDPRAPVPGRVKGPYTAETYPVSLEGEYLVVDLPSA